MEISVRLRNIVLFKAKDFANFQLFRRPGSFQLRFYVDRKVRISGSGFLNQVNQARGCNFRAAQNLVSEHSDKRFQLPIHCL